jgi:hypothetical protein
MINNNNLIIISYVDFPPVEITAFIVINFSSVLLILFPVSHSCIIPDKVLTSFSEYEMIISINFLFPWVTLGFL